MVCAASTLSSGPVRKSSDQAWGTGATSSGLVAEALEEVGGRAVDRVGGAGLVDREQWAGGGGPGPDGAHEGTRAEVDGRPG